MNHIHSLSEEFHENSKMNELNVKINKLSEEEYLKLNLSKKLFYQKLVIKLPEVNLGMLDNCNLGDSLFRRKSCRSYDSKPMSVLQLSILLKFTNGIKSKTKEGFLFRYAPSAGGLFCIETYIFLMNVEGIPEGLYYYDVFEHSLVQLQNKKYQNFLKLNCNGARDFVELAHGLVVLSANFKKIKRKYGERGYRYSFLDAGHIAQNYYLVGQAINCGVCGIGGFVESSFEQELKIDGVNDSPIYALTFGIKGS